MAVTRGLGKGLDALFADNALDGGGSELINIDDITPDRQQPRRDFSDDRLEELAASIREHGVLQPLLLRPLHKGGGYMIVAGERRWRAARLAGLSAVPAVVRELTDEQAALAAVIENLQREDLNPAEAAEGMKRIMDEFSLTQEQLAQRLGKPRSAVANSLRILSLPPEVLEKVRGGALSFGHAKVLASLDPKRASLLADAAVRDGLSVRETEKLAAQTDGKERKEKQPKPRTSLIVESEKLLRQRLARKVSISGSDSKGVLSIEYCGDGDLAALVSRIADGGGNV